MPLKAVLFDLWETLINDTLERSMPRRAWRSGAVLEVLQRYGCDVEMASIQSALDASTVALSRMHEDCGELDTGGRAFLFKTKLMELTGLDAPESAIPDLEAVITSMPLELAPAVAPHAVETTSEIKRRGLATGLICNAGFTTTPHLLPLLAHHGLSPNLDVMVFSDEVLMAKPDPRIFATALDAVGLRAADCAFVGDNPHTDIYGAQEAGFFAVQIGSKERDGITPDARIDNLSQLLAVLDGRAWPSGHQA